MNLYRSCRVGPRKCSKNPLKEHFGVSGNDHGWANSECDREKCVQNKPPSVPRAEKISIFWRVCDVSMSWRLLSFFLHLLRKRPIFPNATVEARVTLCAYSDATLNYHARTWSVSEGRFPALLACGVFRSLRFHRRQPMSDRRQLHRRLRPLWKWRVAQMRQMTSQQGRCNLWVDS